MAMIVSALLMTCNSCDVTIPGKEDVPELITRVALTFTPLSGDPIVVTAVDPDGDGVQSLQVEGSINLSVGTMYMLTISLTNELAQPGDEAYDITAEVEAESAEHLIFFGWTSNLFSDPAGDGNIDNRSDPVNYNDEDANGLPLGISTSWTTGNSGSGSLQIVLKHQPDLKSETSKVSDGETDMDITFEVVVQ